MAHDHFKVKRELLKLKNDTRTPANIKIHFSLFRPPACCVSKERQKHNGKDRIYEVRREYECKLAEDPSTAPSSCSCIFFVFVALLLPSVSSLLCRGFRSIHFSFFWESTTRRFLPLHLCCFEPALEHQLNHRKTTRKVLRKTRRVGPLPESMTAQTTFRLQQQQGPRPLCDPVAAGSFQRVQRVKA